LSAAVLDVLSGRAPAAGLGTAGPTSDDEPYSDDAQLALYLCYELHYRSFAAVDDELEWDPDLLRFRQTLERPFLAALRSDVAGGTDIDTALAELLVVAPADGTGPSSHLLNRGDRDQLREYVAHRSLYHLKEADPQARLFAEMMVALDLDPTYGHYLDVVPGVTLATVNAMSLFGLHRALRGALVGQFASVEITSSPGAARLARAVRRLNGDEQAGWGFYDEHVEADAVHEQVVRLGVVKELLAGEPHLAGDLVFGIQVDDLLESRLARHLLQAWKAGQPSLLEPLPAPSAERVRSRWLVSQKG